MALIDIQLPKSLARALRLPQKSPRRQQLKVLRKLLKKARFTEFGQLYRFDEILLSKHPGKKFQEIVPTFDYNSIHAAWWHQTLEGKADVCWPGKIQLCMEKVIEKYNLNNIHEIWPNLGFFVHGGVSFDPYKKGFEKLLGKPITYIETYLASEGFIAYQDAQYSKGMKLVTNQHIFLEFVPFDNINFDADGNLVESPEVYMIHEVEEGKDYALLLSTSAGAWRYLIGDTIRFVDKERCEIIITGRTKHFLSLVGEHLSVDNMNKAVQLATEEMNLSIPEFTVAGVPHGLFFAHQWWLACNDPVDEELLREKIDQRLKELNDDYAVERNSALKDVYVKVLPEEKFMEFMRLKGKIGGQHKFPRVLKGNMLLDWQKFLETGSL